MHGHGQIECSYGCTGACSAVFLLVSLFYIKTVASNLNFFSYLRVVTARSRLPCTVHAFCASGLLRCLAIARSRAQGQPAPSSGARPNAVARCKRVARRRRRHHRSRRIQQRRHRSHCWLLHEMDFKLLRGRAMGNREVWNRWKKREACGSLVNIDVSPYVKFWSILQVYNNQPDIR